MASERSGNKKAGTRRKRRQCIINPAFQWKYTLAIMATVFLVSVLMTNMLFGMVHQQARASVLQLTPERPWEHTITIVVAAGGFAVVIAIAFGMWSLCVTHRICGPLHVVSGFLGELAAGRFPTKRPLRQHDEFKEFYEQFWRAVDALKAKRDSDLAILGQALAIVKSGANGDHDDQKQVLASVAARMEELCRQVAEAHTAQDEEAATPTG
jgi:hypothetical protein